jgi:hypothetical protein
MVRDRSSLYRKETWTMNTARSAVSPMPHEEWTGRAFRLVTNVLRATVHGIMEMIRPVVVLTLGFASLLGFSMCLFVACFVRGSHFPMATILTLSIGSAIGIVLYEALVYLTSKEATA